MNCVWQESELEQKLSHPKKQSSAFGSEIRKVMRNQVSHPLSPTSSPKKASKSAGSPHYPDEFHYDKNLIATEKPSQNQWLGRISLSPCTLSSAITPKSRHLFHFLQWKFLPELIRPAADSGVIDVLSRQTLTLALQKPFCMHALLACCGAEIPTHDPTVRELARFHYTRAVAALRMNLNDGNVQNQWMVTMLTVMMLCIYEVCLMD
jgi:hypothetical protein